MLAIEFHPYELVKRRATHHSLLEYQENPGINFIPFVQKFMAAGTRKKPNEGSVAFLQALKYSW
jgi:hypothetical protein